MPEREKVILAMMYCVGDIKEVDENDERAAIMKSGQTAERMWVE